MSALDQLAKRLGSGARSGEPLRRHASYRIGGPADLFFASRSARELVEAVEAADEMGISWRAMGSGSNLLVADEGVEGLVVKASGGSFRYVPYSAEGSVLVHVDAGCMLAAVARRTALEGLQGLEWASNVPGTAGASVVNNSGAFGSCVAEHLVQASLHFPRLGSQALGVTELDFGYRTSRLKQRGSAIVLEAIFRTRPGNPAQLRARLAEIRQARAATQPSGFSVGSVFRNPDGAFSGQLIEEAGLKGYRAGDAEVSQVHANFVLNRGAATARDVLAVIVHMRETVGERFGIWLEPEIELVGRWPPEDLARLRGDGASPQGPSHANSGEGR